MVNFDHPNVMTLTGVILVEGGAPLLVMPYMVKGTLLNYVRENKEQFLVEEDPDNPDEVHYKHVYISIRKVWFRMYWLLVSAYILLWLFCDFVYAYIHM